MMDAPYDCTDRLGIQKMPPGYKLWQLDSGHYLWDFEDRIESVIHWNKWAIYRSAWKHYNEAIAASQGQEGM